MLRVRFAPSPTGFLHIGSARTFIFNWLYARHNGGTMILRIDDTDVERNTEVLAQFHLRRTALARSRLGRAVPAIRAPGPASGNWRKRSSKKAWPTAISPPPQTSDREKSARGEAPGFSTPECARCPPKRATAAPPPARRSRCAFACRATGPPTCCFHDAVYGEQAKSTADIEDFALLRSDGMPTYHLASCADDADLRISHIIRGQDHLTNTFKHVLIFEAAGATPPQFAHLPLLVAPDGTKLSKRRHGPVVSVTTYRDAGFLPQAFVNFLVPAGLVAQGRSRADDPPGTGRRFLLRRRQSQQRRGQLHGGRPVRSQGRLAQRRAHPHPAGGRTGRALLPVVERAGFDIGPRKDARRSRR